MLTALLGCFSGAPDTGVYDPAATPPSITEITVSCTGESGKWALDVVTDAWTGGGTLWLSADGEYVEKHQVISAESALDGTSDHLELSLSLAADFQDVHEGSSTAFNCGTPGLQGLFVVYDRAGTTATDCRDFGDDPSRWTAWEIGECTQTISVEAR